MLVYQPGDGAFGDLLSKEIKSDGCKRYKTLSIFVAYARYSGVARLAPAIDDFIKAGGKVTAAIGLDQRQTSIEALELLQTLGVSVSVFYDEDQSRTYHPKIYLLRDGGKNAWIAVGSSNLTAGGLFLNYEASIVLSGQSAVDAAANAGLASTLKGSPHSKPLTKMLFKQLVAEGYILSEQMVQNIRSATAGTGKKSPVFPRSKKPALPKISAAYPLQPTKKPVPALAPVVVHVAATAAPASNGFWKRLSDWDVSPKSSPGQIVIPRKYTKLLPSLGPTKKMPGGSEQAECNFDVLYTDGGKVTALKNTRLILYTPSPTQKRKNKELRFTFLDKGIQSTLRAGDVLEFRVVGSPIASMEVTRIPAAKVIAAGNYGLIP
jgi:HKD family nuclease